MTCTSRRHTSDIEFSIRPDVSAFGLSHALVEVILPMPSYKRRRPPGFPRRPCERSSSRTSHDRLSGTFFHRLEIRKIDGISGDFPTTSRATEPACLGQVLLGAWLVAMQ